MRFFLVFLLLFGLGCETPKNEPLQSPSSKRPPETASTPENQIQQVVGVQNLVIDREKPVLPLGVQTSGRVVAVATWQESNGEHLLVQSIREEQGKEDNRSAYLYGYHFIKTGNTYTQQWKIQDFVKDCPLDITLEYFPDSPKVEDLDGDGQAETLLLYTLACKGDVSPDDMKLILHKGQTKYAIRGTRGLRFQEKLAAKPDMQVDESLRNAPVALQKAAVNWWKTNEIQRY